ncbi:hypothetical protein EZ242_13065 [Ramlibacter rhizophilus]|uniref:Uncharacterized protein n=1 Tax=Ramlibacter rhizophilus TaxID=1781167 RepID=A0A4Z0BJ75_9BURK|nr:hypothetical protein EZ242_13065 [Ramlibacter rhizophilus]
MQQSSLAQNGQCEPHDEADCNVPDAKRSTDKDNDPAPATRRKCTRSSCELDASNEQHNAKDCRSCAEGHVGSHPASP